jgi:hypothetical protein
MYSPFLVLPYHREPGQWYTLVAVLTHTFSGSATKPRAGMSEPNSRTPGRDTRPQSATPQQTIEIKWLGNDESATQTATEAGETATDPTSVADQPNGVAVDVAVRIPKSTMIINHVAVVAVSQVGAPRGRLPSTWMR